MPNSTLRPWLALVRAPALFTAVSNIVAAHLIVTQGRPHWGPLLGLSLASLCLYAAGMVLNDCFDLDEDRRDRPERPLPAGQIALSQAWLVGWGLLAGGVLLAFAVGWRAGLVALPLAGLILLYDGFAKRYWPGILVMGACRYGNWLLGLSVLPLGVGAWLLPLPVLVYIASLTLLSRVETRADNRWPVILCGFGMGLATVLVALLYPAGVLQEWWALPGFVLGLLLVIVRLWRVLDDYSPAPDPQRVQQAVKYLVIGVIPLDALLVLAGGPWWGAIVVLSLIVPVRLLARHLYVT